MKNAIMSFQSSSKELKKATCLATCSMLIAVSIVLGYFSIYLTESIRISFTVVPIVVIGYLYGPVVCMCAAAGVDIINYMMKPVAGFNIGITVCAILTALIFGFALYQKKFSFIRLFTAAFIARLFVDLLLKTYILSAMYGQPFMAYLWTRLPVQIAMLFANSILAYLMITTLNRSGAFNLAKK